MKKEKEVLRYLENMCIADEKHEKFSNGFNQAIRRIKDKVKDGKLPFQYREQTESEDLLKKLNKKEREARKEIEKRYKFERTYQFCRGQVELILDIKEWMGDENVKS